MKTTDINTHLVDSYYTLLKNLSSNNKLELITRLLKSMKHERRAKGKDTSWEELYGSWELDQSADQFVEELKKSRNFSRVREEL